MRPRHALLAPVVLAVLLAGCAVDARPPARSVPLESVAPQPAPLGTGSIVVAGYALEEVVVAAWFDVPWDAAAGEAALAEMGYDRANATAFRQEGDGLNATVAIDAREDGFWLNVTYAGGFGERPTLEEAHAMADEAWAALEPHHLATLGGFEGRTGWTAAQAPERTNVFAARLGFADA